MKKRRKRERSLALVAKEWDIGEIIIPNRILSVKLVLAILMYLVSII